LVCACAPGPLAGAGGKRVEPVTVEAFDAVDLDEEYAVKLRVDDTVVSPDAETFEMELGADDNLLEFIKLVVEDRVLGMSSSLLIDPKTIPTLEGFVPSLRYAVLRDRASIDLDFYEPVGSFEIEANHESIVNVVGDFESLELVASGQTRSELRGTAETLLVRVNGDDLVDGQIEARDAMVEMAGGGHVVVCVTGVLDVLVSGSGVVTYGCDPDQINEEVTGTGRVEPSDEG
jgi:hypothetical protein